MGHKDITGITLLQVFCEPIEEGLQCWGACLIRQHTGGHVSKRSGFCMFVMTVLGLTLLVSYHEQCWTIATYIIWECPPKCNNPANLSKDDTCVSQGGDG